MQGGVVGVDGRGYPEAVHHQAVCGFGRVFELSQGGAEAAVEAAQPVAGREGGLYPHVPQPEAGDVAGEQGCREGVRGDVLHGSGPLPSVPGYCQGVRRVLVGGAGVDLEGALLPAAPDQAGRAGCPERGAVEVLTDAVDRGHYVEELGGEDVAVVHVEAVPVAPEAELCVDLVGADDIGYALPYEVDGGVGEHPPGLGDVVAQLGVVEV